MTNEIYSGGDIDPMKLLEPEYSRSVIRYITTHPNDKQAQGTLEKISREIESKDIVASQGISRE